MQKQWTFFISLCAAVVCEAQPLPSQSSMQTLIEKDMGRAVAQYKGLMQRLSADSMPKSYNAATGKTVQSGTGSWTSGFYPGTLWYLYEATGDAALRQEAEKRLSLLQKEADNKTTHDLGFMMYCSFGNGYRLTRNEGYRQVLHASAQSLSTRYRPAVGAIQSWDNNKVFRCPVIIDNMMNLELLYWAGADAKKDTFKAIAVRHANTTLQNHFRPDNSSYHVVDYDVQTGAVLKKATWQGAADSSAWSRGQAWGL